MSSHVSSKARLHQTNMNKQGKLTCMIRNPASEDGWGEEETVHKLSPNPQKDIINPSRTSKQYKSITLDNGLSVLLVSNKEISQAAAAMTVRVGSFVDPPKIPSLSHLLEHMIFMGSPQFPGDNELKDFLNKHGGNADASTKMEHNTFYMRVERRYLRGALEKFAQLFIQPLMRIEHIEKEIILSIQNLSSTSKVITAALIN